MAFTSFPIETKKFTELVETTSIDGTEQLAVVDGGVSSRVTVDNLVSKYILTNVVIVKSEADFPAPIAGVITLVDQTVYQIVGQVFMANRIEVPSGSLIKLQGSSYLVDSLLYLGSDTFITGAGMTDLFIDNVKLIGATGLATLFNLSGDPLFRERNEVLMVGGDVQNFASLGTYANMSLVLFRRVAFFQVGFLTLNNVFAFTFTNILKQNFITTNGPLIRFLTNLNQAEIQGNAFFPSKGESIFDIDPAILNTSGISIGPGVPYQGVVISGIIAFADNGGGSTLVTVANGHPFENGDIVGITNSGAYDGGYLISSVTATTFVIPVAFTINTAIGSAVLIDGLGNPIIQPFFTPGVTGSITAYATNGAGGTTVTSTAHGQLDGQTLFIDNDPSGDYFGGYAIFNVTANTFDISTPFTQDDGIGTWDTGSLDQTNNVVTVANSGGIIPDSQTVAQMNIPSSVTVTINNIGVPEIVNDLNTGGTNIWSSNLTERFRFNPSEGTLTHIGRTPRSLEIVTTSTVQKVGGGSDVIGTFIAIDGNVLPESKQTTQSSDPTGVTSIAQLTVQPNQTISLAVQNDSSTSNVIVDISNLIIRG